MRLGRALVSASVGVHFCFGLVLGWVGAYAEETPKELLKEVEALLPEEQDAPEDFCAPMESDPDLFAHLFGIPAPRGLVCDRLGNPIAVSKSVVRCALRLNLVQRSVGEEDLAGRVMVLAEELREKLPSVILPKAEEIEQHWEHRPWVPFPLSVELPEEEAQTLAELETTRPELLAETLYTRDYRGGESVSHWIGYVGREMPDQHGPLLSEEPLWPRYQGRAGLERSLDEVLRGQDGVLSQLRDADGELIREQIARTPKPGGTVITSISLPMQQLAARILAKSGRPGSFVVVDAETGDVLVMVSQPGFDPNVFIPSVSPEVYEELSTRADAPFFNRSLTGAYPPGSTFKPLVALAAMDRGAVMGSYTRFAGPPGMDIDGKYFKNWNSAHEGMLDVHQAMLRSCNTWFYQAGMATGSAPVLQAARFFGLGRAPEIPLDGVASGHLPEGRLGDRGVANLAIGQGEMLVSPLQMAVAMAGLAHGRAICEPRLVLQVQDPITGELVNGGQPRRWRPVTYRNSDVAHVLAGMWGVVNHSRGTGRSAAMSRPRVYGKTGTAQWFVDHKERRLAWFTGFVNAEEPRLAFAVLSQGREGEGLSGGKSAAPLAGEFLRTVYGKPEEYGVKVPTAYRPDPIIAATAPPNLTPVSDTRRFFLGGLFSSSRSGVASSSRSSRQVTKQAKRLAWKQARDARKKR